MLEQITFYTIFGMPMIAYGGIITLLCLLFTAAIPKLQSKHAWATIKLHMTMAKITIALALIHGILGILALI